MFDRDNFLQWLVSEPGRAAIVRDKSWHFSQPGLPLRAFVTDALT